MQKHTFLFYCKIHKVASISLRVKQTNLLEKILGLIGKKNPESLMLRTRFGIHTFGVKFPIDLVVLDKKKTVVKLKKSLQPNNVFFWNPVFDTILELPQGTIQKKAIVLGTTIAFLNLKSTNYPPLA